MDKFADWHKHDKFISWTLSKLPDGSAFNKPVGLGIVKGGEILAAVVYDNYIPACKSISFSVAVADKSAISIRHVKNLFHFPFCVMNCQRITNAVESTNAPSLALTKKLGFKLEAILRNASFNNNDVHVFGMLAGECRWI